MTFGNNKLKNARKRIKKRLGATGFYKLTEAQLRSVVTHDENERIAISYRLEDLGVAQPEETLTAMERSESEVKKKQVDDKWRKECLSNDIGYHTAAPKASLRFKNVRDLKVDKRSHNHNIDPQIVFDVLNGSSAANTRRLMSALTVRGPLGELGAALFRAQKASDRAKLHRGYATHKYKCKEDQLSIICGLLSSLNFDWGWGIDEGGVLRDVLYVDLPTGQVSFHSPRRLEGPDYDKPWDTSQCSQGNIVGFITEVIREVEVSPVATDRKKKPKTTFRCELCGAEKKSTQRVPSRWKIVFHHSDELVVCSEDCQRQLVTNLDASVYSADFEMPSGKHVGTKLKDVPEEYLFFCRDKIESANSILRQAARSELVRRYPNAIVRNDARY